MSGGLFETVFVPIANPKDAEATARAIHHYASPESEIIVTHVVEKAGGAPDKASVEQREQYAEEAYETFVEVLPEQWGNIRFLTLYGRDVAATISEGGGRGWGDGHCVHASWGQSMGSAHHGGYSPGSHRQQRCSGYLTS